MSLFQIIFGKNLRKCQLVETRNNPNFLIHNSTKLKEQHQNQKKLVLNISSRLSIINFSLISGKSSFGNIL